MYIYMTFMTLRAKNCPSKKFNCWWAQMSFIDPIAHLKAKNCPSGPKTVPPRNLIVI